jgi:putative Holliday junction resolvase
MTKLPSHPTIEDYAFRLQPGERIAGLDLGTKTIGIAISDVLQQVASPRVTIKRRKFTQDAAELLALCKQEAVRLIVIGLPVNMDGTAGRRVQATRAFARNLAQLTDLPIVFWDERLSSAAVERMLVEADASRARRAELVDKLAAAYILQGALDRLQVVRKTQQ